MRPTVSPHFVIHSEGKASLEQIEQLQAELAKEREHSREQSDKFAQLADQAQRLHSGTLLQIPESTGTVDADAAAPEPSAEPKKPGFFAWLRGK